MRIALVSAFVFDDCVGGAENHIRFLSRELQRRGHEIRIFKPLVRRKAGKSLRDVDGLAIEEVGSSVSVGDLRSFAGGSVLGRIVGLARKLSFAAATKALRRQVREYAPDLVWQHDFLSSWLATRLLSSDFPVVLTNHQGQYIVLSKYALGRAMLCGLMSHYTAVIGPSSELTPARTKKAVTIYNGVDCELFHPLREEERRQLRKRLFDAGDSSFILFCPRRWAPTKGVHTLIEAVKLLEEKRAGEPGGLVLVFAGSGYSEYPRYAARIQEELKTLRSRVVMLGDLQINDMVQYYQAADIVAIPSLMEAVSLSALEAMACNTAVLATSVGGMSELLEDGVTGYLAPPSEARAMAGQLGRIMGDRDERRRVAEEGGRLARSRFSWAAVADQTMAVLESSVEGRVGSGEGR